MKNRARRVFLQTTARYGLKAGAFAATTVAATGMMPSISKFLIRDAKASETAKYRLRFGASVINDNNERHLQTALYKFVEYAENMSDGEINIQLIDQGQACAEPVCAQMVSGGVLDIGVSSAQNAAAVIPYMQALDWPFLWRDRATLFNLFHDPSMNPVFRDVLRNRYNMETLYSGCELRSIFMGMRYADRPDIRTPEGLRDIKLRITNSTMIQNFAESLDMNPIPLAWVETLEGMKSGVVDGMESWPSAASGFGMTKVTTQVVDLKFGPGNVVIFMSARSFDRLPERLQEMMREAARQASADSFAAVTEAQDKVVGNGANPGPESEYVQLEGQLRNIRLTEEEMDAFRHLGSVEQNPNRYARIRSQLDDIAGVDVFGMCQDFEKKNRGKPFNPTSWWT